VHSMRVHTQAVRDALARPRARERAQERESERAREQERDQVSQIEKSMRLRNCKPTKNTHSKFISQAGK
jgi:hypothetical protein